MNNESVTIGDTVTLKSGSPVMTVNSQVSEAGGSLVCYWFLNGEMRAGEFMPQALVKAMPTGAGMKAAAGHN